VAVAQKDTWILERLKALFGGTIGSTNPGMSAWQIHGARARGFLFTIYSLLSPRRKVQVRKALDV
jgi:hypothetical protein